MSDQLWCFEALDTLFFRDGKPFNAGESGWVDSQFPPAGYTLQGAIRTAVLDHLKVDLAQFKAGTAQLPDGTSLRNALGDADSLGGLSLTGPFLCRDGEILFPAPLDLVKVDEQFALLKPAHEAVSCDLGSVHLPSAQGGRAKALEGHYVAVETMKRILQGKVERMKTIPLFPEELSDKALADKEPKVGIARDNAKRTVKEGMIYTTAAVRPRGGVALAVLVGGVDAKWRPTEPYCHRLGGEGKLAALGIQDAPQWPEMPALKKVNGRIRFKLVLTTPALMSGGNWLPDVFKGSDHNGVTVWSGKIKTVPFYVISGCLGKAVRIGGWDIANNRPRDLQAYVPSGSVYFCEADVKQYNAVCDLHGDKIGFKTEYGFGHVLVGTW